MKILCITPIDNIKGAKENLESIGDVTYFEDITKKILIIELIKHKYDVIFTNPNRQNFKLDDIVLHNSSVKIICTASTGTNHIDKEYCEKNGINIISITTDYDILETITSTAEMAFTLMMMSLRNIVPANQSVINENWDCEPYIGRQVNKLTIGIIGYGRLGTMMASYCKSFGAEVLIYDPYKRTDEYYNITNLNYLFSVCDVISLHVHVNEETKHMINKNVLNHAKENLILVNTSRGEIVDEDDVYESLKSNILGKYATDVLEEEFGNMQLSRIWRNRDEINKILIVPHIGGMTHDAREIAYNHAINKLKEYKK